MFHYIEGRVTELENALAVIDCGGVGFALNISLNTRSRLNMGDRARLYVSESIREDAFELYGFYSRSEKNSFELLVGISGVGPKAALSILSSSTPESLTTAILAGDEKALTVAPGIGKKIAQRVIYELRDRIAKETGGAFSPVQTGMSGKSGGSDPVTDAMAALAALGYGAPEISAALRGMDASGMDTEGIIKAALKNMMK